MRQANRRRIVLKRSLQPRSPRQNDDKDQRVTADGGIRERTSLSTISHCEAAVLLGDLRGFSAMAAALPPDATVRLLNRWFAKLSEVVVRHRGIIDGFKGDSIMAVFFRDPDSAHDHVRRALVCAVDMQIAMDGINRQRDDGAPELYMGVGINTGVVAAGRLGSELYSVQTIIGEEVNLASRIEALSLRGQILISESTFAVARDFVLAGEPLEVYVKGSTDRIRIREVFAIPALDKEVPRREARRSPRAQVLLPFSYYMVEDKIVRPGASSGLILDIGYYGVQAEVRNALPLYTEVRLSLELPLIRYRTSDVYARVVKVERSGKHFLAGFEFTSIDAEAKERIQLFVQRLVQSTYDIIGPVPAQPVAEAAAAPSGRRRAGHRPGLVRETVILFSLTAAFLQYYFLDVLLQIQSLPQVKTWAPITGAKVLAQALSRVITGV